MQPEASSPPQPLRIVESLLKSPADLLRAARARRGPMFGLGVLVATTMLANGLVIGAFGGGAQFLWVPLKLSLGLFLCALICLPSLHIFSCLSGAQQSLRDTGAALLMGVALMGLVLVGFAPIAWLFSQATSSAVVLGGLHLAFLGVSIAFGMRLLGRAMTALNEHPIRGIGWWTVIFVLVVLQMTTTLRPLLGSSDGAVMHGKLFFVTHWLSSLSG